MFNNEEIKMQKGLCKRFSSGWKINMFAYQPVGSECQIFTLDNVNNGFKCEIPKYVFVFVHTFSFPM